MGVIGILTCEILEQEFGYLLANDKEIVRISVLEDAKSAKLIKVLSSQEDNCLNRFSRLRDFRPLPDCPPEVLVRVLELGLHKNKKILQEGLIQAATEIGPHVDVIVLGYGLCGNALQKPNELLAEAGVPIIIPWDEDHPVDDCVGMIIGGREKYYGEQCKTAGTFFMIPGWTYHWKRMFEYEMGNLDVKMAKRIFKNYERSLLISSPVMSHETMEKNMYEFSEMLDLRIESRAGTLKLLQDAWQSAKEMLDIKTVSLRRDCSEFPEGESKVKEHTGKPTTQKTKVFLIAGFLGSGKTTLLKRILIWQEDLSETVVLVNEFGEVGIDGALLGGGGTNVVELTNGCICCTLTADLRRCLSEIQEKFKPKRILIESSGVADPAAVVSVLAEPTLAITMELEKIVTVLDADYWEVRENFGSLFFSQLETADLILLNKIDLVNGDLIATFLQEIHDEIIGSQIVPTIRCAIDPDTLWSPTKFKVVGLQPMRLLKDFSPGDVGQQSDKVGRVDEDHSTSVAANNFITFSFQESRSLDEKLFKQFVDQLPWELFRMKGPVQFADRLEFVSLVGGKSEWSPWEGEPQTRLAFIGWNIDTVQMLGKLEGCLI